MNNTLKWLLTSSLLGGSIAAAHAAGPAIDPNTLQLTVDGQPYFIRGMNYAPETRGWPGNGLTSVGPQGQQHKNGAWLCSGTNEYSPGDWQSACGDNDLAGKLTDTTVNNKAYNAALTQVWDRDLGDMQRLGVNTIRLYDVQASQFKKHTDFLNEASQHGIRVIFPALTTYTNSHPDTLPGTVTALVNETCPSGALHPAILAYNVGNELPLSDAQTVANIHTAISIVRRECPGALVSYTDNDDISGGSNSWIINPQGISPALELLGNSKHTKGKGVDVFMVNEYRNDGNGGLSAYDTLFQQIQALTTAYQIPFAIGETGQYDNQQFSPNWYNNEWAYLLKHSQNVHNLGALYFEYNDEPIKKDIARDPTDNGHQQFMGIVTADWPKGRSEEEYIDVPTIHKGGSYAGIPSFSDSNGVIISFPYSNQNNSSTGRYSMFSDGTVCNYQTGPSPSPTSGPCTH
ncbi:hypothetical protein EO087_11505 [Dyella sp. M7H15-1]|uniref:hypothetical protein n=1 Tax=Dyella sp. M7H15-1 TaxID=2501295 RepID=UPI00100524A5|nr:hypothetical protein [Dyella sp. M7H15-1]QAU24534.1 hypothetical protein EO087_11505 [Dyella sp. M7H15-1]